MDGASRKVGSLIDVAAECLNWDGRSILVRIDIFKVASGGKREEGDVKCDNYIRILLYYKGKHYEWRLTDKSETWPIPCPVRITTNLVKRQRK